MQNKEPLYERILQKAEQIGFKTANFVQKVTIGGLVVFIVYNTYALANDYRTYFKVRKDPKYAEFLEKRANLIKDVMEESKKENK